MNAACSHVVVFDNDRDACTKLQEYLGRHDLRVTVAGNRQQVFEMLERDPIDLLVMELQLQGEDGMRLTRDIRQTSTLPIVVLSGLIEEADRILGLEMGADDYVTKPFSPRELLARIRAVLRRSRLTAVPTGSDQSLRAYRFAGWELNVRLHRLLSPAGSCVEISRGEFSLLCALLSAPQRVLTRDQLLEMSRLHSTEVYDRSVDVQIMRLRRKIEPDVANPQLIRTARGMGYYLDTQVSVVR